jgi:hypothetical protein
LAVPVYSGASPSIAVFDPERAADVGREPEAIKTGGDQLEQRAAAYQAGKVATLAGENDFLAADQAAELRNIIHGKALPSNRANSIRG